MDSWEETGQTASHDNQDTDLNFALGSLTLMQRRAVAKIVESQGTRKCMQMQENKLAMFCLYIYIRTVYIYIIIYTLL